MKRTLALTVVTALCAVSPFVAGAAMSSLQQPGADAADLICCLDFNGTARRRNISCGITRAM